MQPLFFRNMRIKYKLICAILLALVPILIIGALATHSLTKRMLRKYVEAELRRTTDALASAVDMSATGAIKNYLRAVAEKNLELVSIYHGRLLSGQITEAEFTDTIHELFAGESIGESGYIFCINSEGKILYHPDPGLVGIDLTEQILFEPQLEQQKTGYLEYQWKNSNETEYRDKALYMAYFEPLDWIISVSAYRDEFSQFVRLEDVDQVVHAMAIGKYRFAFVTDHSGLHYHASADMESEHEPHTFGETQLAEMISRKEGTLTYRWRPAGESSDITMRAVFHYLPTYGWLVGAASAETELLKPIGMLAPAFVATTLLAVLSVVLVSFWFGSKANKLLYRLISEFEKGAAGDFSARLPVGARNEQDILARHFNTFMEKLEASREGLLAEIEKRRQSENELHKLAMAIEQATEMVVITDIEGVIEYVNPSFEKVTGYSRQEAIGNTPRVLKSGLHDEAFYKELWRIISAGGTWSGRLVNKNKKGELFHEDATITPMRDENSAIAHYVASKRDVTAQVQLENHFRQAQRIEGIGSLAGGIAHDFNNILSGIMGYTEICLYDAPENSPLRSRLDKVLQASQRAKELIRHIQTFSRQATAERKPVLLHSIIQEAMKLLRASIPSSIEFNTRIEKVGILHADPTQVHQIIMNLCTNASHAMKGTEGILTVTLTRQQITRDSALHLLGLAPGGYARIEVGDTGCGIPEEIREKIFDPYFTTKPEGEGSGLGLSVVHGIVKGLDGHIEAASEVKRGTTFTVYLPLAEAEAEDRQEEKPTISKGNGETVLVVDDDAIVLEITREMLMGLNYRPVPRNSAVEALNLFRANPERFKAVLTDLTMPGMNGVKLAEEIRKVSPGIPIILASGFGDTQVVEAVERQGLAVKLDKPIALHILAERMHQCLHRRKGFEDSRGQGVE